MRGFSAQLPIVIWLAVSGCLTLHRSSQSGDGLPLQAGSLPLLKCRERIGVTRWSHSLSSTVGHLNSIIRGWANYYSRCTASETFGKADHLTWVKLTKIREDKNPFDGDRVYWATRMGGFSTDIATIERRLGMVPWRPLLIRATGRQCRQMVDMDKRGFPRGKPKGPDRSHGFRTGDLVRAVVTKGVHRGTYMGRVAIKSDGSLFIR